MCRSPEVSDVGIFRKHLMRAYSDSIRLFTKWTSTFLLKKYGCYTRVSLGPPVQVNLMTQWELIPDQNNHIACHATCAGCVVWGNQGSDPNHALSTCQHIWHPDPVFHIHWQVESCTRYSPAWGCWAHSFKSAKWRELIHSPHLALADP